MKQIIITDELEKIIQNHVKGYTSKEGTILHREYFIDPFKGVVIIKLTIDEEQKDKKEKE